jgi:hypothetical protein
VPKALDPAQTALPIIDHQIASMCLERDLPHERVKKNTNVCTGGVVLTATSTVIAERALAWSRPAGGQPTERPCTDVPWPLR